jgi:hypothetical protein
MPDDLKWAVIVAMVAMRMVKMAVDEIIDVIAVRHGLMSTPWAMHVPRLMTFATMIGRASVRVSRTHFDDMLVDVIAVRMVEMAIMQIIDVVAMANGCVTTAGAMLVIVIGMMRKIAGAHRLLPFRLSDARRRARPRSRSSSGYGCRRSNRSLTCRPSVV